MILNIKHNSKESALRQFFHVRNKNHKGKYVSKLETEGTRKWNLLVVRLGLGLNSIVGAVCLREKEDRLAESYHQYSIFPYGFFEFMSSILTIAFLHFFNPLGRFLVLPLISILDRLVW